MFLFIFLIFKKDFIYLFFGEGKGGRKRAKKHQCVVVSCAPPTGDLACNPGMCPDWESNQTPFGSQWCSTTEPFEPGPMFPFKQLIDSLL